MGRYFSAKQKQSMARKVQELRAQNVPFNDIAEKLGVSRNTAEKWAKLPLPVLANPIEMPEGVPTGMVSEGPVIIAIGSQATVTACLDAIARVWGAR